MGPPFRGSGPLLSPGTDWRIEKFFYEGGEGHLFGKRFSLSPLKLPPFPSKNFYQEALQDMAGLLTVLGRV